MAECLGWKSQRLAENVRMLNEKNLAGGQWHSWWRKERVRISLWRADLAQNDKVKTCTG